MDTYLDRAETNDERALATIGNAQVVDSRPAVHVTQADRDALKGTVGKGCSDAQFRVFMLAADRLGLDPFARQIVPIVQGGNMTPQVTIDGFRLIAERTGKYAGQLGPFWCGKDGEWQEVWLADEAPVAAKVGVLRRDFAQPMWGVARYKSYAKGGTWTSMPDVMIAKVAESLALRKAFPQELSGVYTQEEMDQAQAENEPAGAANVSPMPPRQLPRRETPAPAKATATAPATPEPTPIRKRSWSSLRLRALKAGIAPTEEVWGDVVCELTGKNDGKAMTNADYDTVEAFIADMELKASAQGEQADAQEGGANA